LRTPFLAWLVVAVALGASVAHAQHAERAPADLLEAASVPDAPADFETITDGSVSWTFPSSARDVVETLRASTATDRARVQRDLDVADAPAVVRVARDPDEMRTLAPPDAPPPPYAAGVTYPHLSLVLLTLSAPSTWERPPVDRVLVHEWSHLVLHRALRRDDGPDGVVPLWFDEGLAIHEARERSLDRVRTLWEGTVRGTLTPLDELSARFPERPHAVDLAYAESADFVGWLFTHGDGGPGEVRRLLVRMRGGQRFEEAISQTYSAGIGQLEVEWRGELGRRYAALPLLLGSSFAWLVVLVLLVLAYRRRRRDDARTLARWEAEEAAARLARAKAELDGLWQQSDAEVERAIEGDAAIPPALRDDGVPRVVHDGREHTLH
jgi:hypothetical protein